MFPSPSPQDAHGSPVFVAPGLYKGASTTGWWPSHDLISNTCWNNGNMYIYIYIYCYTNTIKEVQWTYGIIHKLMYMPLYIYIYYHSYTVHTIAYDHEIYTNTVHIQCNIRAALQYHGHSRPASFIWHRWEAPWWDEALSYFKHLWVVWNVPQNCAFFVWSVPRKMGLYE